MCKKAPNEKDSPGKGKKDNTPETAKVDNETPGQDERREPVVEDDNRNDNVDSDGNRTDTNVAGANRTDVENAGANRIDTDGNSPNANAVDGQKEVRNTDMRNVNDQIDSETGQKVALHKDTTDGNSSNVNADNAGQKGVRNTAGKDATDSENQNKHALNAKDMNGDSKNVTQNGNENAETAQNNSTVDENYPKVTKNGHHETTDVGSLGTVNENVSDAGGKADRTSEKHVRFSSSVEIVDLSNRKDSPSAIEEEGNAAVAGENAASAVVGEKVDSSIGHNEGEVERHVKFENAVEIFLDYSDHDLRGGLDSARGVSTVDGADGRGVIGSDINRDPGGGIDIGENRDPGGGIDIGDKFEDAIHALESGKPGAKDNLDGGVTNKSNNNASESSAEYSKKVEDTLDSVGTGNVESTNGAGTSIVPNTKTTGTSIVPNVEGTDIGKHFENARGQFEKRESKDSGIVDTNSLVSEPTQLVYGQALSETGTRSKTKQNTDTNPERTGTKQTTDINPEGFSSETKENIDTTPGSQQDTGTSTQTEQTVDTNPETQSESGTNAKPDTEHSEESAAGPSPSAEASTSSDDKQDDKDDGKSKKKNRCGMCRKKVGLTGFECRCGGLFCAIHRYSDKHDCSFDYRELGAQEIRRNNPVVVGEKIQKI
ncbi:hypothetical protein M8J77_009781 [Diaphorina citri]|nr:hypothetical protein M8J77_009781 [Diaphorina citri]